MTGLEKIVKEIEDEARTEADATIAAAKAEAGNILDSARAEADSEGEKIASSARQSVQDIEASQESALALQRRQRTLETKHKLLDETLQMALEELYKLPDDKYFSLLLHLAASSAEAGEGEMLLNEKDLGRMPASFAGDLAKAVPAGSTIAVSKETRPIDGGFVLKYGDVEENCSFAAMFDARREEFTDKIRDILF